MATRPSRYPHFWIVAAIAAASLVYLFFALRASVAPPSPLSILGRAWRVQDADGLPKVVGPRESVPPEYQFLGALDLKPGDVILGGSRAGEPVQRIRGQFSYMDFRRSLEYESPFQLVVSRKGPEGEISEVTVSVPPIPAPPQQPLGSAVWIFFAALFPVTCIFTAIMVAYLRPGDPNALNASLLFLSAEALTWPLNWALFPPVFRELAFLLCITLFSTSTALFLRFFLLFPSPSPLERRAPWLKKAGLAVGITFTAWNINWHLTEGYSLRAFRAFFAWAVYVDRVLDSLFVLLFLLGLLSLGLNLLHLKAPDERRRLGIVLAGSMGLLPVLVLYLNRIMGLAKTPMWVDWLAGACSLAFPICFAVAVARYRLFGAGVILRRGLQFALLSRGFLFVEGAILFLLLFYGLVPALGKTLEAAGPGPGTVALGTAVVTMAAILGVRKVNRRVMHRIERRFFREAYDARQILTDLSLRIRRLATDPEQLIDTVLQAVVDALHPSRIGLFLKGSQIDKIPFGPSMRDTRRRLGELGGDSFYCHWHQHAQDGHSAIPGRWPESATLDADSLLVERLKEASKTEPASLEVRLGDPRSWSVGLAGPGREAERALVEGCDLELAVPLVTGGSLMGFLGLGTKLSEEPYTKEDRQLLVALAQQTADTLEHAQLLKEGQEQAMLKREMEIAREVQERLFPREMAALSSLDYAGICKPAREVGGDYYDFLPLSDSLMAMALGDISGKGVSAALLMANLQAMLRIHAKSHGPEAAEVVRDINALLCSATDQARFATLFYGIYDSTRHTLNYVNAGHNPPLLVRRSEEGAQVQRLRSTGTVLGVFPGAEYRQDVVHLRQGDLLILYSDGITEAMDARQEFFGDQRLEELVSALPACSAREVRDRIMDCVETFSAGRPQNDDITLITARVVA
jgi:sigma-B regulation protein RsbU (phosphoserine phosphatase)